MLKQIAPSQRIQFIDTGLQDEILGIGGELPKLLQRGQTIGRLLHSSQKVPVLLRKGGQSPKCRLLLRNAPLLGEHCFQIIQGNIDSGSLGKFMEENSSLKRTYFPPVSSSTTTAS